MSDPVMLSERSETYADSAGLWHATATLEFAPDYFTPYALHLELVGQAAIKTVNALLLIELVDREHKAGETVAQAQRRIRAYLKEHPPRLEKYLVSTGWGERTVVTLAVGERPAD